MSTDWLDDHADPEVTSRPMAPTATRTTTTTTLSSTTSTTQRRRGRRCIGSPGCIAKNKCNKGRGKCNIDKGKSKVDNDAAAAAADDDANGDDANDYDSSYEDPDWLAYKKKRYSLESPRDSFFGCAAATAAAVLHSAQKSCQMKAISVESD